MAPSGRARLLVLQLRVGAAGGLVGVASACFVMWALGQVDGEALLFLLISGSLAALGLRLAQRVKMNSSQSGRRSWVEAPAAQLLGVVVLLLGAASSVVGGLFSFAVFQFAIMGANP